MEKNLEFDIHETIQVRNETIRGFLLNFNPRKTDGTLCPISDLNKIGIDIVVKRTTGREIVLFEGYMYDLLVALYGQTTRYELCKKETHLGYMMRIDLSPYALALNAKDELLVKIKAQKTAFTSVNSALSNIAFETISALNGTPNLPQVKYQNIGNGISQIDMELGDNVFKIVALTDLTSDYITSVKAKLESGTLTANGNYEKTFTERSLLSENMHYFDNNPDSDIEDLVVLWEQRPISGIKLRGKLSMPADKDAKVLTVGIVSAY